MNRSNPISPLTRVALTTCAAAIVCTFTIGCGEGNSAPTGGATPAATQPARETIAVKLAPVSREPIPDLVDFVGTLYGDEESLIASKVSGRVLETRVDLGDRVGDGAVLLVVDPTDARLEFERRESALREALATVGLTDVPPDGFDVSSIATVRRAAVQEENAKARLDRAKQLFESKPQPLISQQDFDDTNTQYAVAKQDLDVATLEAQTSIATARSRAAELAVAKQTLADTEIRAPIVAQASATRPASDRWAIAERRVSVGEYVAPGSIVYRLVTDQPIKLRASVPERYVAAVKKDQPVSLWVDASSTPVSGHVSRVSPAVDVASRTFTVEMTFANADRLLKPGGFGRGQITIGERRDVTTLPPAALFSFAGLDKVFTESGGIVTAHTVTVLSRNDQRIVIGGDLGGAQNVITTALARLANGDKVTIAQ